MVHLNEGHEGTHVLAGKPKSNSRDESVACEEDEKDNDPPRYHKIRPNSWFALDPHLLDALYGRAIDTPPRELLESMKPVFASSRVLDMVLVPPFPLHRGPPARAGSSAPRRMFFFSLEPLKRPEYAYTPSSQFNIVDLALRTTREDDMRFIRTMAWYSNSFYKCAFRFSFGSPLMDDAFKAQADRFVESVQAEVSILHERHAYSTLSEEELLREAEEHIMTHTSEDKALLESRIRDGLRKGRGKRRDKGELLQEAEATAGMVIKYDEATRMAIHEYLRVPPLKVLRSAEDENEEEERAKKLRGKESARAL